MISGVMQKWESQYVELYGIINEPALLGEKCELYFML